VGGGWCRPIIVLSFGFGQAEQNCVTAQCLHLCGSFENNKSLNLSDFGSGFDNTSNLSLRGRSYIA
jgi:hypothetical protein